MDPIIENDWLNNDKQEPVEEVQHVGNIARSWQWRERGINPPHGQPNKTVLENTAEDILVQKTLNIRSCDLPGYPRSTFLMVFSPDGTKVASTHGNHNVYVSELASGKHVRILKGHPRTPWCIAFHPSHPQLIGSGCLGGQVRVWDLSGGSEVWTVSNETVIASIAFHPRDQLLVIATFNELYFWDWSQPAPFTKVCTNNINEKVRYVAFDSLGYKLITGISVWGTPSAANSVPQPTGQTQGSSSNNQGPSGSGRRDDPGDDPGNRDEDNTAQEMIVHSYQNLVQRYDSLVRNYQRLFMARHHLTNPSSTNTMDRGTDPMETDSPSSGTSCWTPRAQRALGRDRRDPAAGNSSQQQDGGADSGDGEGSSSRLLNLDVLSINSDPTWSADSNLSIRESAYQRLNEETMRLTRDTERNDDSPRWLPNPFSSSSNLSRYNATARGSSQATLENNGGSSRTSVFTSHRLDSPSARYFLQRRRNAALNSRTSTTPTNTSPQQASPRPSTNSERRSSRRPETANSSTQISPAAAQTINESLDLIRDILRDSGTRLLNLINNMSLSTLASVERSIPRRGAAATLTQSDESEGPSRPRPRPRVRLFSTNMRRELLSSESDSDSDHSMEVNLFRRRNASFQGEGTSDATNRPTDRVSVDLNSNESLIEESIVNMMMNNDGDDASNEDTIRFRLRSHSTEESGAREQDRNRREATSSRLASEPPSADPDRPSTSRDTNWMDSQLNNGPAVSSEEAFRKVKAGVTALHKHTVLLSDMWLRGSRTSMRDLRNMWENLRRRVLSLHRQTGRNDVPSYYTRSLMERCRFLAEMSRTSARTAGAPVRNTRSGRSEPNPDTGDEDSRRTPMSTDSTSSSVPTESEQTASASSSSAARRRQSYSRVAQRIALYKLLPSPRRRLQSCYRWRPEDEQSRRRAGGPRARGRGGAARGGARSLELHATRDEIRMRSMQVLSIMFNMMMSCLEERGLSQLIIQMLRMLKKALALTCLMLMTNRLNRRQPDNRANRTDVNTESENITPPAPRATGANEDNDRQSENVTNAEEANNDRNADEQNDSNSSSSWPSSESDDGRKTKKPKLNTETEPQPSTSKDSAAPPANDSHSSHTEQPAHPWSNRLAVQISAANRNTSATARNRRDHYLELKRQKALHRTNPAVHPITKRKILPPAPTYRIPSIRVIPPKQKVPKETTTNQESQASLGEPIAGPSGEQPGPSGDANREPVSFAQRVRLCRIAHMHALRLRNAARNRFRRLQTIRLYTPSSVREMFALQSNNNDNPAGNQSTMNNATEPGTRRPFTAYRPHILTTRNDLNNREGSRQFDYIFNNVAVSLVNDMSPNEAQEGQSGQPQRLPRVHEYLQPIILAQNTLVVEEGGGGGGAGDGPARVAVGGLLDAGLVSEALPASTHRVQAWDFTTGDAPHIADNTKNVVVPRCRIHNDASIDISKDGRLLVALLPLPRLRIGNHWVGVYSLEWGTLGQLVHSAVLEQSAVSVALSPTARYLAVGLGSRRITTLPHARNNVFALLYKLARTENSARTGLPPVKELEQNWEQWFTSLNCLRWAPQPGQGLVYANNTGQLIIMS